MRSAVRVLAGSLMLAQGSALSVSDSSILVQETLRFEKPKPHVNLEKQAAKAEEKLVISSELEDVDDTRMEYIRAGVATMKKLKTVGNVMKVLTGQTSYANVMPLFQQAFKSEQFLSAMRDVSSALNKNASASQYHTDISTDRLKQDAKKLETDEEVIKLLQNFYEDQRQLTLETKDAFDSAIGQLASRLPKKALANVQGNLQYVVGAMRAPLQGVARLYEKFINTKPEHACRDLGYILRNTTGKKDTIAETFQEIELTTREFPTVLKGVVSAEALENVTKTVTGFFSAFHAVYRNFDHNDNSIIAQVGSITQKKLKCDWKHDGSVAGGQSAEPNAKNAKTKKALKPEEMST